MKLRSGHGSTSAGAGLGLGEGQDDSGRGNENGNGESHEDPLLGPPPPPPPAPPMTHAEMMADMLAAHRESAHAMELLAQVIVASPIEALVLMAGTGVVPTVSRGPVPTRTS
jgi:hypothetical protein